MKNPITKERWVSAQQGEKEFHIKESVEHSYESYKNAYGYYFKYLDINPNLEGKSIIEIGPGRIASLLFCENYSKSYIIEPTEYDGIDHLYEGLDLSIIQKTAEEWDFEKVDEVWLFNLLQHVQDPDLLIKKCKESAKVIRYFEPLDLPTDNEHPFTFNLEDFKGYFGDSVKIYESIGEPGFHGARCVYGVYNTKD